VKPQTGIKRKGVSRQDAEAQRKAKTMIRPYTFLRDFAALRDNWNWFA
jgi:hypothetical protein